MFPRFMNEALNVVHTPRLKTVQKALPNGECWEGKIINKTGSSPCWKDEFRGRSTEACCHRSYEDKSNLRPRTSGGCAKGLNDGKQGSQCAQVAGICLSFPQHR